MKKLIAFIFLTLPVSVRAQADHAGLQAGAGAACFRARQLAEEQVSVAVAKGAGKPVRLIARSIHGYSTNSLIDSVRFVYSGNRFSLLDNANPWKTYYEDTYSPVVSGDNYDPAYPGLWPAQPDV